MDIEWINKNRPTMDELYDQWLISRQSDWTYAPCEDWRPLPTFSNPDTKIVVDGERDKVDKILK